MKTNEIIEHLEYLKKTIQEQRDEISGLKTTRQVLREKLEDADRAYEEVSDPSIGDIVPEAHNNLRMVSALEKILDNLDYINVEELENLTAKTVL